MYIVKTSFGEYKINGIYRHYKGAYYRLLSVSKLHDSQNVYIISYHTCDINGVYISIRENAGTDKEIIVHQPFATHETRWFDQVTTYELGEARQVKRFELIK